MSITFPKAEEKVEERLTPGELRSNAEKIRDELIKERVLAGIALLEESYGPDWVDRLDLATLNLNDGSACILGQVYNNAPVTEAQWEAYAASPEGQSGWGPPTMTGGECGYVRGLAIIDGPLTSEPDAAARYGFLVDDSEGDYDYDDLTGAWRVALGATWSPEEESPGEEW